MLQIFQIVCLNSKVGENSKIKNITTVQTFSINHPVVTTAVNLKKAVNKYHLYQMIQ